MMNLAIASALLLASATCDARHLMATSNTTTSAPSTATTSCELPQAFSRCNYEAFSAYGDASLDDATKMAWANGALNTYQKRKGESDTFEIVGVPLVCQNEYEDKAFGMVIEAKIGDATHYFEARPYGSSTSETVEYDCIKDLCQPHEHVSHCDDDNDDDDD